MNASFDGSRKRLAELFNELCGTALTKDQHRIAVGMREVLGMQLCMYDPSVEDDCSDLSDSIGLETVPDLVEENVVEGEQA